MRRSHFIVLAAAFGMVLIGNVTGLPKLTVLSIRGREVTGEVVRTEPGHRGMATIRITFQGSPVEVSAPCVGFDCDPGSQVPVTVLPDDISVRAAGRLNEDLWTSIVATFLIGPLMFGGGVAYSLGKQGWPKNARSEGAPIHRYRLLPVLMSLGVVMSSVIRVMLGDALGGGEIAAAISAVAGSVIYLFSISQRYSSNRLPQVVSMIMFGCCVILLALEWVS